MAWTPERMGKVMELWKQGISASSIAAQIGGVSRNAVIGVVHRHGHKFGAYEHPTRMYSVRKARAAAATRRLLKRRQSSRAALPVSPLPPPLQTDIARMRFVDRMTHNCAWIIGEPTADAMCCGATTVPGLSYCEHHAHRCYRVPDVVPRKDPPPAPATSYAARTRMRQTEPA